MSPRNSLRVSEEGRAASRDLDKDQAASQKLEKGQEPTVVAGETLQTGSNRTFEPTRMNQLWGKLRTWPFPTRVKAVGNKGPNIDRSTHTEIYLQTGFPRTAAFIASDRDKTSAIFKRFEALSARNLLHLQGRLAALEAEQTRLDDEDKKLTDRATVRATSSWEDFAVLCSQTTPEDIPEYLFQNWKLEYDSRSQLDEEDPLVPKLTTVERKQRWELAMAIQKSLKEYSKIREPRFQNGI
jgi:hypothetical protein